MNYLAKVGNQLLKNSENIIVVPGGQNADNTGTSASFGLGVRYNELILSQSHHLFKGIEWFIVPKFKPTGEPEEENQEIHYLEEPLATMVREVGEETGLKAKNYVDLGYRQRPHYEKTAGVHLQHAYLITNYDDRNIHKNIPLDGKTGIPFWIPQFMARRYLWKGHHWILDLAELYLLQHSQLTIPTASLKKAEPALV